MLRNASWFIVASAQGRIIIDIMDKAQQIIQKFLPDVNCVSNTIGAAFESEGTQCNTYRAHLKSGTKCDVVLIKEGWSSLDLDDLVMHTTDGRAIARILEIDGSTTYRNEDGVKYKLVELRPEKERWPQQQSLHPN